MNAEDHLIAALAAMEGEKATQPLKNYAISDLRRVVAVWKSANGSVYQNGIKTQHAEAEWVNTGNYPCVCKPGLSNAACLAEIHKV